MASRRPRAESPGQPEELGLLTYANLEAGLGCFCFNMLQAFQATRLELDQIFKMGSAMKRIFSRWAHPCWLSHKCHVVSFQCLKTHMSCVAKLLQRFSLPQPFLGIHFSGPALKRPCGWNTCDRLCHPCQESEWIELCWGEPSVGLHTGWRELDSSQTMACSALPKSVLSGGTKRKFPISLSFIRNMTVKRALSLARFLEDLSWERETTEISPRMGWPLPVFAAKSSGKPLEHTHTHTRTHTHTHTHPRAHTHTHTHTSFLQRRQGKHHSELWNCPSLHGGVSWDVGRKVPPYTSNCIAVPYQPLSPAKRETLTKPMICVGVHLACALSYLYSNMPLFCIWVPLLSWWWLGSPALWDNQQVVLVVDPCDEHELCQSDQAPDHFVRAEEHHVTNENM